MIEGLNDAAAEHANKNYATDKGYPEEHWYISWLSFNKGAKWQLERMYSDVDMINYALYINETKDNLLSPSEWLKQVKKK